MFFYHIYINAPFQGHILSCFTLILNQIVSLNVPCGITVDLYGTVIKSVAFSFIYTNTMLKKKKKIGIQEAVGESIPHVIQTILLIQAHACMHAPLV